ncbi:MAG: hypothetical protein OEZ39_02185 [Gammaproteobacteria bacterium]|nr:hypothetical protein [Gammaproteobacteria bacterium]MDH5650663.1 hypothetical protein [Gammaproteobacteria bacterium]
MLFTNVMKTLVLLALFVVIPVLLYRLLEAGVAQGYRYCRTRLTRARYRGKVR